MRDERSTKPDAGVARTPTPRAPDGHAVTLRTRSMTRDEARRHAPPARGGQAPDGAGARRRRARSRRCTPTSPQRPRCRRRGHAPGDDHDPRHPGRGDAGHGGGRPGRGRLQGARRRPRRPAARTADRGRGEGLRPRRRRSSSGTSCPTSSVVAYAFNRQVPGPRIRVTEGDRVRINVTNHLPEATSVHWHGLILPNAMDGAAEITQEPIEPGETFTYEFTATQAGTLLLPLPRPPRPPAGARALRRADHRPQGPGRDAAYDYDQELVVQLQEWLSGTATPTRRCRWRARSPTTSPSTARPTRRPRPSSMRVGETAAGALHRHQQHLHPPDAHPRRPVPDRRDRRQRRARRGASS